MNRYEQLMSNTPLTFLRQGQFIVAVIIYAYLLLAPNPQVASAGVSDLVLHAIGNAILMVSAWLASGGRYKGMGPLIFVVPFSVIIELAQGLTDNRTPQLMDIIANFAGAGIGFILCGILSVFIQKYVNER